MTRLEWHRNPVRHPKRGTVGTGPVEVKRPYVRAPTMSNPRKLTDVWEEREREKKTSPRAEKRSRIELKKRSSEFRNFIESSITPKFPLTQNYINFREPIVTCGKARTVPWQPWHGRDELNVMLIDRWNVFLSSQWKRLFSRRLISNRIKAHLSLVSQVLGKCSSASFSLCCGLTGHRSEGE